MVGLEVRQPAVRHDGKAVVRGDMDLAPAEALAALERTIDERRDSEPEESYTARLLQGHEDQLLKKIGEEATEVVMAAKDADPSQLRYEIADLVYHLMVVMVRHDLTLEDVAGELASRRS